MRRETFLLVIMAMLAACSSPAETVVQQEDLSGEYVNDHTIMHVGETDWEESMVRDSLSIVQNDGSASFHFMLVQTNYHTCEMQGVGRVDGSTIFVAPEPVDFGGEEATCTLRIEADSNVIRLVDPDNVCRRYYCGARAGIDQTEFPRQ